MGPVDLMDMHTRSTITKVTKVTRRPLLGMQREAAIEKRSWAEVMVAVYGDDEGVQQRLKFDFTDFLYSSTN